MKNKDKITI